MSSSTRVPVLEARSSAPAWIDTDLVAVFQDGSKKAAPPKGAHSVLVGKLRKQDAFNARSGSVQFVRFGGRGKRQNSIFVGLGAANQLTPEKARLAAGHAYSRLKAEKCSGALVHVGSFVSGKSSAADVSVLRAFAEGLVLGAYHFAKYRAKSADDSKYAGPTKICFLTTDKKLQPLLARELAEVNAVAIAANVTRDWSNEPSNFGTPEYFAAEAKRLAREYGLKCTILGEKEAEREKMGLFLGVGRGSVREGKIVVLEYNPKLKDQRTFHSHSEIRPAKTIALVGKGVTFDSGGISIKPSMRMEEMKHDMTGAATIMGAILLASKWKVPNRVIAVMAFTENMPDGDAIQPGNVISSRNGKTVEIINTDAEGRLILADVLDYAQDFKPDAVIDVATLTGAVSIALGKLCCGIMGNDDELINEVREAGAESGERIWQLPLFDEYFDDLRSDYADMKNSCNDSYGGTIRGAIFLKQFIRKGVRWAHLDIAATAANVAHLPYYPKKGATGAYVRTLARFVADF